MEFSNVSDISFELSELIQRIVSFQRVVDDKVSQYQQTCDDFQYIMAVSKWSEQKMKKESMRIIRLRNLIKQFNSFYSGGQLKKQTMQDVQRPTKPNQCSKFLSNINALHRRSVVQKIAIVHNYQELMKHIVDYNDGDYDSSDLKSLEGAADEAKKIIAQHNLRVIFPSWYKMNLILNRFEEIEKLKKNKAAIRILHPNQAAEMLKLVTLNTLPYESTPVDTKLQPRHDELLSFVQLGDLDATFLNFRKLQEITSNLMLQVGSKLMPVLKRLGILISNNQVNASDYNRLLKLFFSIYRKAHSIIVNNCEKSPSIVANKTVSNPNKK